MVKIRLYQALKRKYAHARLRNKILLSIFLVVMIVNIGFASFFFLRYTQVIEQDSRRQFSEFCTQAVINLNSMFSSVEYNGKYILNSTELLRVFRNLSQPDYTLSQVLDDYFSISEVTVRYNMSKAVRNIRYYFNTDAIYTREKNFIFSLDEISGTPWYERMLIAKGAPFWIYLPEEKRISCFQAVYKNVQTGEILGVLEQELDRTSVLNILNSVSAFSLDSTVLMDHYGEPAYFPDEEDPELFKDTINRLSLEEKIGIYPQQDDIYAACRLENQFILAGRLSNSYFRSQMSTPVLEILAFCFLAMIIAAILAGIVSKSLSGRIRRIIQKVSVIKIDSQDYLSVKYDDEITEIELMINQFLDTIRTYILENNRIQQQKKEADFRVLQEQINPHFLYNCLDSINWMALSRGENQIAQMSLLLGRFYRLSLSKGNQMIPFSDELEHVKVYLAIMQMRMDNTLCVHYDIDDSISDFPILKILLQPLVENAILHGINGRIPQAGTIWITARTCAGGLQISVRDDGVGMSEARLQQVRSVLKSVQVPQQFFGLWNMSQRIFLHYGKDYGIVIRSAVSAGTTVSFELPRYSLPDS